MECPQNPLVFDEAAVSQPSEDDLYNFAPDAPAAQPDGGIATPASAQPSQPVPLLNYRSVRPTSKSGAANFDTDKFTKLTAPIWILTVGLAVESAVAAWRARSDPTPALIELFFGVGVRTVLMMAGVFIVTKMRRIEIGSFATAVLRIAAIAIAPSALSDLLAPLAHLIPILGSLALLILDFVLYFALLGMFFDMDESDTWSCVWVIFLINVGVYLGLIFLLK